MRNIWLLPDYQQVGTIYAVEGNSEKPFHDMVDLTMLPSALVLGIPEEILAKNMEDDFVFGQFCRTAFGTDFFSCSIRAGKDKTGRSVTLTNLQILDVNEKPEIPPIQNDKVHDEAAVAAHKLVAALTRQSSRAGLSIIEMLEAVKMKRDISSFSSERLYCSANPPGWMPKKKIASRIIVGFLLLCIAALCFVLLNRASYHVAV